MKSTWMKRSAALALLVSCALSGAASAQTRVAAPAKDSAAAKDSGYAKITHLPFDEGDEVIGEMQRPDGDVVHVRGKIKQDSLLRVRTTFHYEMIKSAELR
jgi:hypothetical protein